MKKLHWCLQWLSLFPGENQSLLLLLGRFGKYPGRKAMFLYSCDRCGSLGTWLCFCSRTQDVTGKWALPPGLYSLAWWADLAYCLSLHLLASRPQIASSPSWRWGQEMHWKSGQMPGSPSWVEGWEYGQELVLLSLAEEKSAHFFTSTTVSLKKPPLFLHVAWRILPSGLSFAVSDFSFTLTSEPHNNLKNKAKIHLSYSPFFPKCQSCQTLYNLFTLSS